MLLKVFYIVKSTKYKRSCLLIKLAILSILTITISAGCASKFFKADKTNDKSAKPTKSESTLIKPRLAARTNDSSPNSNSEKEKDQPQSKAKDKKGEKSTSESNVLDAHSAKRAQSLPNSGNEGSAGEDKAPKRLVGSEKGKVPPESEQIKGDKPGDVKMKESKDSDWMTSLDKQPSFKKHDHTKYVNRIKKLAMDVLKRENKSFYATLCCDSTTEEWSLTIYFKRENSFSYKSLVWDPIDDKWERMYESGSKPLAGWKKHLSYVTSDKRCSLLKGTDKK